MRAHCAPGSGSVGGVQEVLPRFEYAVESLPPGRVGFRRWRWQLWHGAVLLASGWRHSPRDAERALFKAAARRAHELLGVHALRPETAEPLERFFPGASVRIECGAATCVIAPRSQDASPARAAA
ncbi:MAG: hypothetical protein QOE08_86 [Thermoleophilaceae bacterium]|nr:hypothetical protein [Thermoleophilaceae bacterium]